MKKYLFGLGAMIVGAGLMFGFTHTEVSAKEGRKISLANCETIKFPTYIGYPSTNSCKIGELTCVIMYDKGISCVKSGGIFK